MPAKPRTAARKPAVRKTSTSSVLRLDRQENVDKIAAMVADREPLFSVGDQVYTIPKQAPAAWTLKATELGSVSAVDAIKYAMTEMLGEDGYAALSTCPTLTMTDLETVRDTILGRVLGGQIPKS